MNYLAFRLTKYWTFSYDICFFLSVLTKLLAPAPQKKKTALVIRRIVMHDLSVLAARVKISGPQ